MKRSGREPDQQSEGRTPFVLVALKLFAILVALRLFGVRSMEDLEQPGDQY